MLRSLVALILIALVSPVVDAQNNGLPKNQKDFHLYLLIGQSNMAGRGAVTDADKTPIPNILMLNQQNQWVPAVDPIHFDKPNIVGVGLGRTFAIEIAKQNPDAVIGLIPCAVGGSPIASWEPGGYHSETKTHPYDEMLPRLLMAMKVGTLKGILWHQGESDCQPQLSEVYESKLHTLIARLRTEVGDPNVPIVVGQMGQFPERPWNDDKKRVDAVHRNLPDQVSRTAFVNSDDLEHKGDNIHFNAESYRELGRRYANAYQTLVD
ncbi:sialate O-acetylesterase [Rubripirellula amarantea]|nr:sialate O-acetylesterase [Rubripirellula amarantea]